MNIDGSRLNISSQYDLMKKLFSGTQGKSAGRTDPMSIFADEETAAKNRAKYFDENGEPINSSGEKGRYIGGGKNWKKIVSVSEEVKTDLAEVIKEDFIKTNGIGTPEGSSRTDVINKYLSTISSDKRSSASWTLNSMAGDYATQLEELVKKNNPGWRPGDSFDTSILNQLDGTLGGVDFQA